ncbi:WXG100 family type VII secretion target [Actinosynnema sp. NPDC053489]|uniref:WXG100 family type VII secretion target n=1 Tax=Actinosynnema sp. NPDC053489 TaxID=3363916 RepID=UPI0037CAD519
MNAPISINSAGVLGAAGYLEEVKSTADRGIGQVRGSVEYLRTAWTGTASIAFQEAMVAWDKDCNDITKSLTVMVQLMRDHATTASRGEDANTAIAGSIPVGPGLTGL